MLQSVCTWLFPLFYFFCFHRHQQRQLPPEVGQLWGSREPRLPRDTRAQPQAPGGAQGEALQSYSALRRPCVESSRWGLESAGLARYKHTGFASHMWSLFHQQLICTQNVCSHPEGDVSEWMPLQLSDNPPNPHVWSAQINPGNCNHSQSIAVHICSPVLSSVGLYHLQLHIETFQSRRTFALGSFVLLFNPWLKGGPHTLPLLSTMVVPRWCSAAFQMIQCTCPWVFRETSISRATMGWCLWAAIRTSVGDPGYMVR